MSAHRCRACGRPASSLSSCRMGSRGRAGRRGARRRSALMCYQPVTAQVIEAAPKLKGIVKYGVGIDAIDIEAARRAAHPGRQHPEYAEETVAEGAFALMIALAKKLVPVSREMTGAGWAWPTPQWLRPRSRRPHARHCRPRPDRPLDGPDGERLSDAGRRLQSRMSRRTQCAAAGVEKFDDLKPCWRPATWSRCMRR